MLASPIANPTTRLIRDHEPWNPWGYQRRSVTHLIENRAAALFLDPGLGKTAVVLEAFRILKQSGMVRQMLVVAPLRVCQLVWRQEGRKWTQFRDLTFTLLHGPKKDKLIQEQTDIHIINPEGIPWITQRYFGRSLPYDIVTLDELTKFKNHGAERSKRLRRSLSRVQYRWGLTGSPAANGYMDLFGQFLILDDGAALGRYITYFRDQYFNKGFDGFSYVLRDGAAERIEARIAPYVLRMSAEDYLELPTLKDNIIRIELPPDARRKYEELKKEMILSLPEGVVTAANSAAVYTKLAQLANGAVYYTRDGEYAEIHTAKLDALENLIEELAGQPLLVGYEFQSDLARIRERLGDVPTLTAQSEKNITQIADAWNRGEIPVLLAHPASAGHGLNLQGSGASHICWFSRPWDLDLYDQFIKRILRQGTTAPHIINHVLQVADSIDEIKAEALSDKDVTQKRLLKALNAEVVRDDEPAQPQGEDMALKKLGFQGQQPAAAPAQTEQRPTPRGWGAPATTEQAAEGHPAQTEQGSSKRSPFEGVEQQRQPAAQAEKPAPRGWGSPAATPTDPQREAVANKLRAPEPQENREQAPQDRALAAFGSGVVQQLTGQKMQQDDLPFDGDPGDEQSPAVPRGWGPPASAPAGETTNNAAVEPDAWGQLSGRVRNALQKAGFETPHAAWQQGKSALVSGVDGFGAKGWEELEALYGPETAAEGGEGAESPAEPSNAAREAASPAPLASEPRSDRSNAALVAADGANPDTLATLFEAIASLLRGR